MIGIYILTCVPTGLQYVGQSKDVKRRVRQHLNLNTTGCRLLYDALIKYGSDSFISEIIECHPYISKIELTALERKYIRELNTLNPNGYNLTKGGQGQPHSQETKDKIGIANSGRVFGKRSAESIEKQKRFGKDHHMYGKKHKSESKTKMSKSCKQSYIDNPDRYLQASVNGKKGAAARWGK